MTHASERKVDIKCDYCGKVFKKSYKSFLQGRQGVVHKDCCSDCQNKKNQESLMETYGINNCSYLPDVKQKISDHKRGSNHHNWQGGISALNEHLRCLIEPWRIEYLKSKNYKCEITGDGGVVNLHHRFPFHTITKIVLKELNLPMKAIGEYTDEEIHSIEDLFLVKHNELSQPIVLREDIHKLYHHQFGCFNNTPEEFEEFIKLWLVGEFDE